MIDRQPTHAGRVRLVPVAGQTNIYDMSMADEPIEQGTPLNKANLLKDATASLYGLTDAVPDDVLAWLGRFNEHCWKRRSGSLQEIKSNIGSSIIIASNTGVPITYGTELDMLGNIINPTQKNLYYTDSDLNWLVSSAPLYIKSFSSEGLNGRMAYIPSGSTWGTSSGVGNTIYRSGNYAYLDPSGSTPESKKAKLVTTSTIYGDWELVFSTNRNTYPDSGISGDYEYEYLGVPFDNLTSAHTKMEICSYVGTGTYGQNNACSVTFSFAPKLALMLCQKSNATEQTTMIFGVHRPTTSNAFITAMSSDALGTSYPATTGGMLGFTNNVASNSGYSYGKKSSDGKTFSWYYDSSASIMFNNSGITYYVLGIG